MLLLPEGLPAWVNSETAELVIVQTGSPHFCAVEWKAQRFDQVQGCPRIRAKPNYVSRVRRDLRLDQNDMQTEGWVTGAVGHVGMIVRLPAHTRAGTG